MDNNEFQRTPCTGECYVRISDLKKAILENPYDPAKGEIGAYLRYLKYNTPFRTDARKKGKWIIYVISLLDGEDVKCSECGQCGCASYWNFCPNCGAEMTEVENETD